MTDPAALLSQMRQGAGLEALDGVEIHHSNGDVLTRIGLRVSLYLGRAAERNRKVS